ncbi:unnamed protein product [Diamesa hyperborea]
MKSKKVAKKQVEEVVEENEEESEIEESEGELPGSDEDSDTSSDEDEEMDEIPDHVESNQTILDQLNKQHNSDDSDDDDAPEEVSSKKKETPKVKGDKKSAKLDDEETKANKEPAYKKEDEAKTVFVGNIPNDPNVNETRIKDLFSPYGEVKSVRFRTESGKVVFSKKIKKNCKYFIGYVVFQKEEDAKKSVALNGTLLLENHLRINMANNKKEAFNNKGTVFVGNLPFDAAEKDIHEHFSQIGPVEYVRIIANKGIAYVCYKKETNLAKVLKLHDKPFKGRNLRVTKCISKEKQDKDKMFKKDPKTGKLMRQKVTKGHKLGDEKFLKGRSNNNPIIKKIKDTQKAKWNKFSEADRVPKKDLFRKGGKIEKDNQAIQRERNVNKQQYFGTKVDTGVDKKKSKKKQASKSVKDKKVLIAKLKSAAKITTSKEA